MSEKIASDRNDELADAESRTPEDPAPETRTAESEVRPEEGTDGTPAVDAAPADDKTGESSVVTNEPSGEPQEVSTREEPSEKDAALKETPAVEAAEKSAAEREAEDPKGSEAALPDSAEPAPAETRTEAEPVPVRKKSLVGKILLALLVLVLLAVAAAGVLYTQGKKKIFEEPVSIRDGAGVELVRDGVTLRAVDVRVRPGDTMRSVVLRLRDAGFELDEHLMRFAFRLHPKTTAPMHSGVFRFPEGTTHAGVIDILTGPPLLDRSVRIPDGAPVWEVRKAFGAAEELEGKTSALDAAAFAKAVGLPEGMSPEGWFAPDTYRYSSGTDDLALWRQAYRRQKETLEAAWATRPADSVLKTPYEALILASIIEKETSVDADRTKVSSVFHNRLKRGMPLQTDPTVIYGIGPDFNGNLTRADLRRPTPYNTYTMNTLPPTPIAMPSKASIEAAVHPADTKYLYFVARGDGTSEFSRTLAEHNRAVRRFILNKNQRSKTKDSK